MLLIHRDVTKDSFRPQEFIIQTNKTDNELGKNNIVMSILKSLGPAKGLFSYSTGYIVRRPTRAIILLLPAKGKHVSL